jgi:hypothetical protein
MTAAATEHHVLTIKGTAMNKDRARIWIESAKLAAYGLQRGERYTITTGPGIIVVRVDPQGERKVAGRERRGKSIPILDLCMPAAERAALFNGAERLRVCVSDGALTITADA